MFEILNKTLFDKLRENFDAKKESEKDEMNANEDNNASCEILTTSDINNKYFFTDNLT